MHAQRKVLGVAVALGVAAMSPWASAQEEPVTTRTMALGGGTYGAALSTSGIYSNPAAMGLARLYHVDSSVLYQPSLSRWSLGSAVVDTAVPSGVHVAKASSTSSSTSTSRGMGA